MANPLPPKIDLHFYRTESGNEPVRDWLKTHGEAQRRAIGLDLQRVQYRWPVGMPLCRALGGGCGKCGRPCPTARFHGS